MDKELDNVILPKTHSSMYLMHKYWARKPANIIASYIQRYTSKGDIVLDPFMGSGVTILESVFNERKSIGVDINPIAHFICKNSGDIIDESLLELTYNYVKMEIQKPNSLYQQLFQIICPICGNKGIITHLLWENPKKTDIQKENGTSSEILNEIRYNCSNCKVLIFNPQKDKKSFIALKKIIYRQDKLAEELIMKGEIKIPDFSFQYSNKDTFLQLRHSLRINSNLDQLYSKKNLLFLSYLMNLIKNLPERFVSQIELMKFCFSSAIAQASKMVWVIDKRKGKQLKRKQVGSWTHHFFWDPTNYFEVNPWICFKERYKKIKKGKEESNLRNRKSNYKFNTAHNFSLLSDRFPVLLLEKSSVSLEIPNNSIDFIFTDPPYGDSIQYGELSSLWSSWLGFNMIDYVSQIENKEIVINSRQNKKIDHYSSQLKKVFLEMYRILKKGKYMILTFHNTSFKIRNVLIKVVIESGFLLKQILFQLPPRVSVKSMLHHNGSPIGDYYIRFQKLDLKNKDKTSVENRENLTNKQIQTKITEIITKILKYRGEPTSFLWISNIIDEELCKANLFPLDNLEEYLNHLKNSKKFLINENNEWWFTKVQKDHIIKSEIHPPLTKEIEKYLKHYIASHKITKKKNTLKQELFNIIYEKFKGIYTPDKYKINTLIENLVLKSK